MQRADMLKRALTDSQKERLSLQDISLNNKEMKIFKYQALKRASYFGLGEERKALE